MTMQLFRSLARKIGEKATGLSATKLRDIDVSSVAYVPSIPTRSIYVGVTGDIRVEDHTGYSVLITNAAVGWHPISATKIDTAANGTTATGLVAAW